MNECVRKIGKKRGTSRMIKRYKKLVEEAPLEHRITAGKRAAVILSVFDEKLNPQLGGDDKKFHPKLAHVAAHVIERFHRVVDEYPEFSGDFVEIMERTGRMDKPVYRNNIIPFIYTLDGIMNRWIIDPEHYAKKEMLEIRMDILKEAVEDSVSMIDFFNEQHIYNLNNEGIPEVFGARRKLTAIYLVRGIRAIDFCADDEYAAQIVESFRYLDEKMKGRLRRMETGKSEYAGNLLDMVEKIAILIGNGKIDMDEDVVEGIKMYGLEWVRDVVSNISPYGR